MFCTNCGASNQDDATTCINCRESLSEIEIGESFSRIRGFRDISISKKLDWLRALFNLSFNQLVSPRMMKFLYGISILSAGLIALFLVIVGFKVSMGLGIFLLFVGAPLSFLLTVIYSRVLLETILVIFRMADHMAEIGSANIEEKPESSESGDRIRWNI